MTETQDTLGDTFSLFFGSGDDTDEDTCIDCGATGYFVLWTDEVTGRQHRICESCRTRREAESAERARSAADEIAFAMEMY